MGSLKFLPSKPPVATIKVRNFRGLREVMLSLDVPPGPILQSLGLDPNLFDEAEKTILYSDLDRLISKVCSATGCAHVGLLVGIRANITITGIVGLASMHAPTVGDALQMIAAGLKLTDTGGAVIFRVSDNEASLGYTVVAERIKNVEHLCDASTAIALNGMRRFCGSHWRPARVYLMSEPPTDSDLVAQFFRAPIQYRSPQSHFVFDSSVLDRIVDGSDVEYREILAPVLETAVQSTTHDFLFAAQSIMRSRSADARLTRSELSEALGVSTHVLVRRLKSAGVTFGDLVEQNMVENAQRLLLKGKRISDVSADLGFSDTSSFTRAFRKWAGDPPNRWRERQLSRRVEEDAQSRV